MSADQIAETIDRDVDRAARVDLSDDGDTSESVTEFYAEILAVKHEALTLRQRAIEVSTMNSFAARSELGQMESELAALHDDRPERLPGAAHTGIRPVRSRLGRVRDRE